MADVPKEWQDLVYYLQGTCHSLSTALDDCGLGQDLENDRRFCEYLDSELMLCETCGWWAEAHEVDDDGNCEDCQDGED